MRAEVLRDAARVYAVCLALTALVALVMLAVSSARACELMPLAFGHVRRSPGVAASIALANARVALVPFALSLVAHQGSGIRRLADCVLAGLVALNAAELGAALAGYGRRTLLALAPHAPLELGAYALAGAAYLAARHGPACPRRLAALAAACALLLVLAAALETYVQVRPTT